MISTLNPRPRRAGRPTATAEAKTVEHGGSIDGALKRGDDVTTVRVQVAINTDYEETLKDMKRFTGVQTITDVVRAALDCYAQQLRWQAQKADIMLVSANRKEKPWQVQSELDATADMSAPASSKTKRLQLLLTPIYARKLDAMRRFTHSNSYAEVVRAALENYGRLLNLKSGQKVVAIKDGERDTVFNIDNLTKIDIG